MKTLVLIPGLLSDQIVWRALGEALAPRMKVHDADLTQSSDIPEMAATVLRETEGPLVVVGHSLGGRVAMEIARQAPDRVAGLVLADTGHHPKRDGEEIGRQEMIDLGHESMEKLADKWLPPMLDADLEAYPEILAELRTMVLRADSNIHERQMRALIGRPDAGAYLKNITCPVLLIVGRQDIWSPVAQHQEIGAIIPHTELVVIENAGHFAPFEQPESVVNTVIDWLDRNFPG